MSISGRRVQMGETSLTVRDNRKLGDSLLINPFAFCVILAPEYFLRTQDSAPKVNLNFHKCEKGLLCSPCQSGNKAKYAGCLWRELQIHVGVMACKYLQYSCWRNQILSFGVQRHGFSTRQDMLSLSTI